MRCSGLAAMHVGVPYAPISPAYSLMSQDFGKLKSIIASLTPGLVFAADGKLFRARDRSRGSGRRRDRGHGNPPERPAGDAVLDACAPRSRPPRSTPRTRGRPRHDREDPVHLGLDRHAQGRHQHPAHAVRQPGDDPRGARLPRATSRRCWSTGCRGTTPSAATTTSAWCSTTAARSTSTRASRCPAPSRRRVRNLREIAPTIYFNVPKGFEVLLPYLRSDAALRERFFSRLQGAVLRRRRPGAARLGRAASELADRDDRRAHHLAHRASARPRRRRSRSLAPGRPSAAGNIGLPMPRRRAEARAERRQARSAAQGAQHHARLLARSRS